MVLLLSETSSGSSNEKLCLPDVDFELRAQPAPRGPDISSGFPFLSVYRFDYVSRGLRGLQIHENAR